MNTNKIIKSLDNTKLVIVAKSSDKTSVIDPTLIKTVHGYYKAKGFINSHLTAIESLEAFIGFDPAVNDFESGKILKETINIKTSEKQNGSKCFFGYIETPRKEELGINFNLLITQIYQPDTQMFCLGYDLKASIRNDELSDFAKSIIDPKNNENSNKPKKQKRLKKAA